MCYLAIEIVHKIFQNNITVHVSIFTGKLLTIHQKSSLLNLHFENQASQTANLVCYCSAVVSCNGRLFNVHWKPLKLYYFKTIRKLLGTSMGKLITKTFWIILLLYLLFFNASTLHSFTLPLTLQSFTLEMSQEEGVLVYISKFICLCLF